MQNGCVFFKRGALLLHALTPSHTHTHGHKTERHSAAESRRASEGNYNGDDAREGTVRAPEVEMEVKVDLGRARGGGGGGWMERVDDQGAAFRFHQSTTCALFSCEQHSSGNHAQAVALAAKESGVKAVIVMPDNAPPVKVIPSATLRPTVKRETICKRSLATAHATYFMLCWCNKEQTCL